MVVVVLLYRAHHGADRRAWKVSVAPEALFSGWQPQVA